MQELCGSESETSNENRSRYWPFEFLRIYGKPKIDYSLFVRCSFQRGMHGAREYKISIKFRKRGQ